MKLLKKIRKLFTKKVEVQETPQSTPFSRWYTFGAHRYRYSGEKVEVLFTDLETGESHFIVDDKGKICRFPGIEKEDIWIKEVKSLKYLQPIVQFRTSFEKWDDTRYIMLWQVQPDGRYWEDDDGFGMENDEEIILYAFLDKKGNFIGKFKIYSVGGRKYLN